MVVHSHLLHLPDGRHFVSDDEMTHPGTSVTAEHVNNEVFVVVAVF